MYSWRHSTMSNLEHMVMSSVRSRLFFFHDDVIKWKHFPRYWSFVQGIHRSPVNSPHTGQWRGALMLSLNCTLNKRLSKQSWGWWLETPSSPLWRHCNVMLWSNVYLGRHVSLLVNILTSNASRYNAQGTNQYFQIWPPHIFALLMPFICAFCPI